MASEMRARVGMLMNTSLGIAVGGDLLEAFANDRPLSRLEFIERADFARGHMFCQILERRAVFHHPILGGLQWLAVGCVQLRPFAFAARNERRIQNRSHHAMGQALSGVAGGDINVLRSGVLADEAGVVDRIKYLPRPAM